MTRNNLKEWHIRLIQLREDYYRRTWPNATADHGVPKPKQYTDLTANGLTRCIKDWINFSNGDAARQNITGIMRKVKGHMKFTRGGGRKVSSDVRAILPGGRAASIEVKIGKDRMSPDQIKEQKRTTDAGGLYFIATNMPDFVQWWNSVTDSITLKTKANAY